MFLLTIETTRELGCAAYAPSSCAPVPESGRRGRFGIGRLSAYGFEPHPEHHKHCRSLVVASQGRLRREDQEDSGKKEGTGETSMKRTISFSSSSGAVYDLPAHKLLEDWPRSISGLYAFVVVNETTPYSYTCTTVAFGDTDELRKDHGEFVVGREVTDLHPTHACFLNVPDKEKRVEIVRDVLSAQTCSRFTTPKEGMGG